jgi:hypothetical protein
MGREKLKAVNPGYQEREVKERVDLARGAVPDQRVVLAMVRDDEDDDRRILEVVKSNGGPIGIARSFKVELVPVVGLRTPQVALTDERESDKSADEALAAEQQKRKERVPRAKLRALILDQLGSGPKSRGYIDQAASDDLGLGSDAIWRYGLIPLKETDSYPSRKRA